LDLAAFGHFVFRHQFSDITVCSAPVQDLIVADNF
jgi:hypothetical protein